MLPLMLDGLLLALLLAVLALGVRLRVDLRRLHNEVGSLEQSIGVLDAANGRSEAALAGLRRAAERAAEQLSATQRLLDDLRFLTGRGEQIADRLESGIREARPAGARGATPQPSVEPEHPGAGNGAAAPLADELQRALLTLR
jgi:Domain of unknown function (DUF6468)